MGSLEESLEVPTLEAPYGRTWEGKPRQAPAEARGPRKTQLVPRDPGAPAPTRTKVKQAPTVEQIQEFLAEKAGLSPEESLPAVILDARSRVKRARTKRAQKSELDRRSRMVALRSFEEGKPALQVILENMRRADALAEQVRLQNEESALAGEVREDRIDRELKLRAVSGTWASDAAPYLHARLAPRTEKGETGLRVSFTIEDA